MTAAAAPSAGKRERLDATWWAGNSSESARNVQNHYNSERNVPVSFAVHSPPTSGQNVPTAVQVAVLTTAFAPGAKAKAGSTTNRVSAPDLQVPRGTSK